MGKIILYINFSVYYYGAGEILYDDVEHYVFGSFLNGVIYDGVKFAFIGSNKCITKIYKKFTIKQREINGIVLSNSRSYDEKLFKLEGWMNEENYKMGYKHGTSIFRNRFGLVKRVLNYRGGDLHGVCKEVDFINEITLSSTYKFGLKNGIEVEQDFQGKKIIIRKFINGVQESDETVISTEAFYDDTLCVIQQVKHFNGGKLDGLSYKTDINGAIKEKRFMAGKKIKNLKFNK